MSKVVAILIALLVLMTGFQAADGQQPKRMPRIGFLVYGSPPPARFPEQSVIQQLRELGWVDGQNMALVMRYAEGRPERLLDLARDLVGSRVDVLVTLGTDVTKVVRSVTGTIPIVMTVSEDPVELGLIASLSRPGTNMTGVTLVSSEVAAKRLQLVREVVPKVSRLAVLWDPTHVDLEFKELEAAGRSLGIRLQSVEVRAPEEFDGAFRTVARGEADALLVVPSRIMNLNAKRIAVFAIERRLPAVSLWSSFAEAGGLMTYGPDIAAMVRRTATHVDRILKGANPGDLPVERPTHFQLVVNLKTAKTIGLTLPQSVLLRADRVIE